MWNLNWFHLLPKRKAKVLSWFRKYFLRKFNLLPVNTEKQQQVRNDFVGSVGHCWSMTLEIIFSKWNIYLLANERIRSPYLSLRNSWSMCHSPTASPFTQIKLSESGKMNESPLQRPLALDNTIHNWNSTFN